MLGKSIRKLKYKIKIRKDIGEIVKRQSLIRDIKKLSSSFASQRLFNNQKLICMSVKQLKIEKRKRIKAIKKGGYTGG